MAVDTLGQRLSLRVTPANEQDRDQVAALAAQVQAVTGQSGEVAFVDQGYTGDQPLEAAAEQGIRLEVIKLPQAKKGFVLLPRRWVVERSFAWTARFRRLARDYERLPQTLAGLHFLAFAILRLASVYPSGRSLSLKFITDSSDSRLPPSWHVSRCSQYEPFISRLWQQHQYFTLFLHSFLYIITYPFKIHKKEI